MASDAAEKPVHNVRIRHEVYERLAEEATRRDRTITSLLNNILEDHYLLDSSPTQRSRLSTGRAARKLEE